MDSLDRMLVSAMRDFDVVLLISLGFFIWCYCVYVINYKSLVNESVKIKKTARQYHVARAER